MAMISFRLSDNELALLATKADEGESLSLAAKRLLLESLGVAKCDDIPRDIYSIVRELIADSIKEGDIGKAIDNCYRSLVGHVEDVKARSGIVEFVDTTVNNSVNNSVNNGVDNDVNNNVNNLTTDVDKTKLIKLLGLEDILSGDFYNVPTLKKDGYFKAIADNKDEIKNITGIEVRLTEDLTDINAIIRWLGFKPKRTTKDNVYVYRVLV